MIQRIQTIFLLLAAGLLGALLAIPFLGTTAEAAYAEAGVLGDKLFSIQDHIGLLILFLLSGGLALISIFLFNNRKVQMSLTMIAALIGIGGLGFGAYLLYQAGAFDTGALIFKAGGAFPILAIIFLFLAYRNIKKDEKTIQSSYSRLR